MGTSAVANSIFAHVGALEEVAGPLSEGGEDGGVLSLDGGSLAGEGIGRVRSDGQGDRGLLVGGEQSV